MDNIRFLSVSEVIHMHRLQVEEFGGAHGIRDLGLLEAAVNMPQAIFEKKFLHKDIFAMAAAYIFHIIKNHSFVDGNKRIGMIAGLTFLSVNDTPLTLEQEQVYLLGVKVAKSEITKEDLANLLRDKLTA